VIPETPQNAACPDSKLSRKGHLMDTADKIIEIIRQNSEMKIRITLETDLRKDLDMDSFETIMIINAIEDEFKITLDETVFKSISTVADIVRILESGYLSGKRT
jgi:acyl carrier protein